MDFGVDRREGLQCVDRGLHKEGHKAEFHPVLFQEGVLVLSPQGHDGLHVHLVKGCQDGGGLLGLQQATGHGPAQGAHGHQLLVFTGLGQGCRGRFNAARNGSGQV